MFKDSCRMLPATTTFELQCLLLRHQVLMSFAAISCFVSHKDEQLKVKYPGDPCQTCPTTVCYKAIQGSDFADCWKYRETVEGTGHSASKSRTSCWNRRRKAHSTHFFCTHTLTYWFIDIYSLIFLQNHSECIVSPFYFEITTRHVKIWARASKGVHVMTHDTCSSPWHRCGRLPGSPRLRSCWDKFQKKVTWVSSKN